MLQRQNLFVNALVLYKVLPWNCPQVVSFENCPTKTHNGLVTHWLMHPYKRHVRTWSRDIAFKIRTITKRPFSWPVHARSGSSSVSEQRQHCARSRSSATCPTHFIRTNRHGVSMWQNSAFPLQEGHTHALDLKKYKHESGPSIFLYRGIQQKNYGRRRQFARKKYGKKCFNKFWIFFFCCMTI